MRIEVLIDNGEPEIYPLNKPEITIGTGDTCDIIVNGQGISRKHVKISVTSDQFFIIDQGSTNGSFINEERLVPGRKVEFTSFFPVRLGDNVLLTLLSDEESDGETLREFSKKVEALGAKDANEKSEATRAFSVAELNKAKTTELVKKRQTAQSAKKSEDPKKKAKKEPEASMKKPLIIGLAIIAGAFYYHRSNEEAKRVEAARIKAEAVRIEKTQAAIVTTAEVNRPALKLNTEDLLSLAKLNGYFMDLVCTTPAEIVICDLAPFLREGRNGVIQVGTSFVILVSEKEWLEKSIVKFPGTQTLPSSMLPPVPAPATEESPPVPTAAPAVMTTSNGAVIEPATPEQIYRMAFLTLIKEKFAQMGKTQIEGRGLYFAFYTDKADGKPAITKVFAVTGDSYLHVLNNYTSETLLRQFKRLGYERTFRDLENYISVY